MWDSPAMPKSAAPDLDLIGSDEAARLTGVDRATFLRWREAGHIAEAHRLPGRNGAYMFHRADVARLAAGRTAKAAS
jgi:predicted site-specific integrase-resolvase